MGGDLMELISLLSLQRECHAVQENIWVEALLLDLEDASTVASTDTGLEIAKLETGKTNVTAVVKEAT